MIFGRAHQRDQIGSYVPFYGDAVKQVRLFLQRTVWEFGVEKCRSWGVFPCYVSFQWSTFYVDNWTSRLSIQQLEVQKMTGDYRSGHHQDSGICHGSTGVTIVKVFDAHFYHLGAHWKVIHNFASKRVQKLSSKMWPNIFWIQWNSGRMWQMLFIGQRSHNVPFFHRNVPCQTCFLQELAAKLEAMNKTAMEKLSALMETSEADRKKKNGEVLATVWPHHWYTFLATFELIWRRFAPCFFPKKVSVVWPASWISVWRCLCFQGFPS